MGRDYDPAPGYTHVWDRRPIGDGTFTIICVPKREAILPLGPNLSRPEPKPRPVRPPRPAPAPRPPKPGAGVMPQPVAKPVKEKKPTKVRQQRAAARPFPVVAVASLLTVVILAANLDAIGVALSAALAAVLYALFVAALTLTALAAGYANGRWVMPAAVRVADERRQAYRDRQALRELLARDIEETRPPWASVPAIALEPVPVLSPEQLEAQADQAWIAAGMRNRRIDGYQPELVDRPVGRTTR